MLISGYEETFNTPTRIIVLTLTLRLFNIHPVGMAYPSSQEQSSAVASGIVGETNLHPVSRQLMCIGHTQHFVPLYLSIDDLA